MGHPNHAQAMKGQKRIDSRNLGKTGGHEFSVPTGCYYRQFAALEFFPEFGNQTVNESAITMDRADEHGLARALANNALDLTNFDSGQQCGFFVQVIGHGRESGSDDSPGIIAREVDDIERHGSAEINDDRRRAKAVLHSNGISKAIGPDRFRTRIIDAYTAESFWTEDHAT